MTTNTPVSAGTVAQLVLLGAIWGGAFTLIKVLVDDMSAIEIAAARLALGAGAVVAILYVRRALRWPGRELMLPIAAVATLDTLVPYTLVGWAETRVDSGVAAVLISAMPLFTVVFAAGLRQETIGPARVAGIAIGFAGVLTLIGGPGAFGDSALGGQLAVIGAAASYAGGTLMARSLLKRVDAANFTAAKLTIGAALAAAAMAVTGGGAGVVTAAASDAAALVALGVVCTGLSFVLYFRVVASVGGVRASTVTYIIPMFGLLFGVALLGEPLEAATVAGMPLIIAGVAAVMYAPALEDAARRMFGRPAVVPV